MESNLFRVFFPFAILCYNSFSTNAFVGPNGFLLSCTNKVVFDQSRKFRGPKSFRWRVFGELKISRRASVSFSEIPGLISHVWHPHADYGLEYELLVEFG